MKRLSLANLPTKIERLDRLSTKYNTSLYIKRDDQTGSELSGNKVRKLEYCIGDALEKGCNMLITCGGIQSNHCRATVVAATRLGMKSAVLLRISEEPPVEGNYFLDKLLGADVHFCTRDEYSNHRDAIMATLAEKYKAEGLKPYIIPEGASNSIGTLGYYNCMKEIVQQERELGITFDTVIVATGSGGTCAGLNVANRVMGLNKRIIGVCVCDDNPTFQKRIAAMANGSLSHIVKMGELKEGDISSLYFDPEQIEMTDKYVGLGYAISRKEELDYIKEVASTEGVVFDPVYTGKAIYAIYNELKEGGSLRDSKNILFIHTGGLFGLFPVSKQFDWR